MRSDQGEANPFAKKLAAAERKKRSSQRCLLLVNSLLLCLLCATFRIGAGFEHSSAS